jgi:hypothetical protein
LIPRVLRMSERTPAASTANGVFFST